MRKKILMIHHSGLIGGASMSFYYTWKALSSKYDVVAYVADDPSNFSDFLHTEGLNPTLFNFRLAKITYYSGGNTLMSFKFWYHAFRIFTQIKYWKSVLEKENPDLVIVNSKVLCWMGNILKNYKSICFVRETIMGSNQNFANKSINRLLDKFTAVTFITDYDLKETGLKKAYSFVTRDFMDIDKYKDLLGKTEACNKMKVDSTKFNVLFVGGINELKGIDVAIKAIFQIKNNDINLLVAGNSLVAKDSMSIGKKIVFFLKNIRTIRFQKEIQKFIENNNLKNVIRFIGVHSDISLPYSACDILILPIKKPHQARPIFEIGVQSKTFIVSDFPNLYDSVKNNYNGLTFQASNSLDLANKILLLKNNCELKKRLGNNNYEYAMDYHNQEPVMEKFLGEIEKVLSR